MRSAPVCLLVLLAAVIPAQDPPTAAAVTEPGRSLSRPLEMFLGTPGRGEAPERTLLILLDTTESLRVSGFADAFDAALADTDRLERTLIGLGLVGAKGTIVLAPTADHGLVAREVRARVAQASGDFQNVYADLRVAAATLASAPGSRGILLVTLDNGDAEDDLEKTVLTLDKAKVQLTVLTSEAYVADSYWAARPYQDKPRGTELTGGDAPVIDLPWGWLFQRVVANEVAPAAYGCYALTRLAAESGGRVHLHHAPNQTGHECAFYDACLLCSGDHLPQNESYWDHRVRLLAPLTVSRQEAHVLLGRDPYFRAAVQIWKKAAQEGLLRSQPPVRLQSTSASPDRQRFGRSIDLTSTLSFARHARRAETAAAEAEELGNRLDERLQEIGRDQGMARQEASARLTRVMLQLTRVNLLSFAAWCRDVAPLQVGKNAEVPPPPELPIVESGRQPHGIWFTNMSLCHGVRPFMEAELPGGEELLPELERLEAMVNAFLQRYGHTQYAFALHRAGIARFHYTYPGIAGVVPRPRPKSSSEENPVTTPRRPPRGGPASTGGTTGPRTGGR